MFNIEFLEYETNKPMGNHNMVAIPRTGEFIILDETVTENWKENFYLVRAVSYTIGSDIMVHVEKLNHAELVSRDKQIKDAIKNLVKKTKEV